MKKVIFIFIFITIAIASFYSCKKDKNPLPDMGYNYFPNDVGRYVIYDVDSLYYDDANLNPNTHFAVIDTFKFQIKEKIESIYTDNLNRPTIRLERYIKYYNDTLSYNQMPWILHSVWAENRTTTTAEKVEENVRYIKLAFPVKEEQIWNGNAQNTYDEWDYKYAYYDSQIKVGNIKFDSVLQVTQYDDNNSTLTERKFYIERYARNVGLIYKQFISIQSQPYIPWNDNSLYPYGMDSIYSFFSKPILQRITGGTIFTMTVNSFGKE